MVEDEKEKVTEEKDEGISLKILARSELYDIKIKKESTIQKLSTDIDNVISEISKSKSFKAKKIKVDTPVQTPPAGQDISSDDPIKLIAMGLELEPSEFRKHELVGIKNENIQILKPNKMAASESGLLILAASEFGLHRKSLPYEEWKELCESSNIKSKTTFRSIAKNMKNYGLIDKKKYEADNEMVLTTKGIKNLVKGIEKI